MLLVFVICLCKGACPFVGSPFRIRRPHNCNEALTSVKLVKPTKPTYQHISLQTLAFEDKPKRAREREREREAERDRKRDRERDGEREGSP